MASDTPHNVGRTESCENCGMETPHTVTIELCVESTPDGDVPLARQPYRVSSCRKCGTDTVQPIDEG
ncbi:MULTISPECIES: hypothetical protein [Halobacterium]|uniref:DUF7835 family putative zinc beta-ribbon protein n=1 Tax=Halobacterium TaxID=2239 RepID=UPI00073F9885|nr:MULTISPECIES: hypothetical protein [Halobacterium]MCG1003924.1 hypothetical protein [Halobacterium noricense]